MSNKAFDIWLKENYLHTNPPLIEIWKAAKADSEQEIAELKNEVIEKCAVVCESSDRHRGEYFAAKIRALKGK